jgi:hypothetical protein
MTRADERKHTVNFYWDMDAPEIAIYPRAIWSGDDVDVDQVAKWIDGDVPADGWRELAADFLERLKK